MRLLLDENAPTQWLTILRRLGHYTEHVTDQGLRGRSDKEVLAFALSEDFTLLSLNRFKRGPDRLDALTAMTNGARIVRVTVRGLQRQERALERFIGEIEESFDKSPALRRATIMSNFNVRYDTETDIRKMLERVN